MPRILLTDDDLGLRKMLRLALQGMGHRVVEARNGKEALAALEDSDFDLLLTDVIMPDQDGLQTIEVVRRQYPDLKIIAMSGGSAMSATGYLRLAAGLGAAKVLAKPFSHDELALALREIFPGKPPAPEQEP